MVFSFSKNSRNPNFSQIFGQQRAKNEVRNTKMNMGQETHPIRFFKKFQKPCLQTDGRTYRRTDRHRGESSIPQFHLRWSGGIIRITSYSRRKYMLLQMGHDNKIPVKLAFHSWSIEHAPYLKKYTNKANRACMRGQATKLDGDKCKVVELHN